jgi:hypothetical protein
MMRSILALLPLFALVGCDTPDMDADEPWQVAEQSGTWAQGADLSASDVTARERAVREEIEEGRREIREDDAIEEQREAWLEIQSARRGEGRFDRWLEGLAASGDDPISPPELRPKERF